MIDDSRFFRRRFDHCSANPFKYTSCPTLNWHKSDVTGDLSCFMT